MSDEAVEAACRRLGIDVNTSAWLEALPVRTAYPALSERVDADVVIVGAGLTGLSTAYQLSARHPNRRIVVLEAREVANGASGRNGGMVLNIVAGSYPSDETAARRQYDATRAAMDLIEAMIDDNGLDVPFRRLGCAEVFTDETRLEEAAEEVRFKNRIGIDAELLEGDALAARLDMRGAKAAVFDPHAAQINSARLLRALAPVLVERNVLLFENSPVVRLREGPTIVATTPGGEVHAKALVLATNGYSPALGRFGDKMFTLNSHLLATAPVEHGMNVAGMEDDRDRLTYASFTEERRVVFGGGSNDAYRYVYGNRAGYYEPSPRSFPAIEGQLDKYFPAIAKAPITHRWAGPLAVTATRVPVIGHEDNVFFGFGYSGCGVALAALAGRIIADLYDGNPEPWSHLAFVGRQPAWIPPDPFRYLGYVAYTRLTGRSPRKRLKV